MLHTWRDVRGRTRLAVPGHAPPPAAPVWIDAWGHQEGNGSFDNHQVSERYAFHLVARGRGEMVHGGRTVPVAAGDAFVFLPGDQVRYREDPHQAWTYQWIGLKGPAADAILAAGGIGGAQRTLSACATPRLWALFDEIAANLAADPGSGYAAAAHAWHLAELISPRQGRQEAADPAALLRQLIDGDRDGTLAIAAAAARLGLDRSTLFRRFRRRYGCSPSVYQRTVRLGRARELIAAGVPTLREVAQACGYRDGRTLARAYRQAFGTPPR